MLFPFGLSLLKPLLAISKTSKALRQAQGERRQGYSQRGAVAA